MVGKSYLCFSDCMNINLEKGPFLHELGVTSQNNPDLIPKKFMWAHGLAAAADDAGEAEEE